METDNTKELLDHLSKKLPLTTNEIALLNLLMQEAFNRQSNKIAERYAYQTASASSASANAANSTADSTGALKSATVVLAIATGILAFSAVVDIYLRIFCGK